MFTQFLKPLSIAALVSVMPMQALAQDQAGNGAAIWLEQQGVRTLDGYADISVSKLRGRLEAANDPWTLAAKSLELQAKGTLTSELSDADLYDVAQIAMTIAQRQDFNRRYFDTPFGINIEPGKYDPVAFDRARPEMEQLASQAMVKLAALEGPLRVVLPIRVRTDFYTPSLNGVPMRIDPSKSFGRSDLQSFLPSLGAGDLAMDARIANYDLREVPTVLPIDAETANAMIGRQQFVTARVFVSLANPRIEDQQLMVDAIVDRLAFYGAGNANEPVWDFVPGDGWDAVAMAQAPSDGALIPDAHAALLMILQNDPDAINSVGFQRAAIDAQIFAREVQSRRRGVQLTSVPIAMPELVARDRAPLTQNDFDKAVALYAKHVPESPVLTLATGEAAPYYVRRRSDRAPVIDMSAAPISNTPELLGAGRVERRTKEAFPNAHRIDVVLNSAELKAVFVYEQDPFYSETIIGTDWPLADTFNIDLSFSVTGVDVAEADGARVFYIKVRPAKADAYGPNNAYLGDLIALRKEAEAAQAALQQEAAEQARREAEQAAAAEQEAIDTARGDLAKFAVLDIQLGDSLEAAMEKAKAHYASLNRGFDGGEFLRLENPMEVGFHFDMRDPSNTYPTTEDSLSVFVSHTAEDGVIGVRRETFVGSDMDVELYVSALTERYGEPLLIDRDGRGDVDMFWGLSDVAIGQVREDGKSAKCFRLKSPSQKRYQTDEGEQMLRSAKWHTLNPECGVVLRIDIQKHGILEFQLVDLSKAARQAELLEARQRETTGTAQPPTKF